MIKISPDLAEICGIHAGDGYLRNDGKRKELDISGNVEEREYYDNHVVPLFNKVFNLEIKARFFPHRNTYGFVIRDREVIYQFHEIGFPYGNKSTIIRIPKIILNSGSSIIYRRFLRGYLDTDGCINFDKKVANSSIFKKTRNFYPRLLFTTCSLNLTKDFKYIASILGFRVSIYKYIPKKLTENPRYQIQICGKKSMENWMEIIGSKNISKFIRFEIWKKFGYCPPNTNYKQRIKILKSQLDPNSLYGPVAQPG